ncbi:hypothetical protein PVIIG_06436 [Plasmodium vivax India VII]|uniref:Uncharacterized protein n=1 Tax=Plasmodium vivax India VII TaxID=1077284 RepID=A0A0J9S2M9_PLAVI|nr:hypothetical protein PVIIG_06436 [Plasmodium vivax India VII]
MSGLHRWRINNFFRYQDGGCLNKYHRVKNNIEQEIDDFHKNRDRNVQREWDRLYKYIIKTDKELQECYDNGYMLNQKQICPPGLLIPKVREERFPKNKVKIQLMNKNQGKEAMCAWKRFLFNLYFKGTNFRYKRYSN